MRKQTILSIAIMAASPFGAHADPVGPAAVPANGTAVFATASAPYVTQTPTADDATHIASTAYVKGAYNDTIAAVNSVFDLTRTNYARIVDVESDLEVLHGGVDEIYEEFERVDREAGDNYNDLTGQIESLRGDMNDKRVKVYTTWDDDRDSATTEVAFVNAQ